MVTKSKDYSSIKTVNQEIFDKHADNYSKTIDESLASYGATHDFFMDHKARLIKSLLKTKRLKTENMHLLDVGCGIGKIHARLGTSFASILGVDVSHESIAKAKLDFPEHTYLVYDGQRLPVETASLDMTLAICVFHHVPPNEWQNLASEMMRALRPGGVAFVIEHNPWNPVTRRIVNKCPIDRDAVLLTRRTTRTLFKNAGAKKIFARTIISIPPKTNFLMTIDNLLGILPFGAQYFCVSLKETD